MVDGEGGKDNNDEELEQKLEVFVNIIELFVGWGVKLLVLRLEE